MSSLIAELQRRNVHRAAVFYAGSAWLVVQVATQVFPFFHIDESVVRAIVIAGVIGFPFALLFSWFYEWTPQGIKRESEVDRSESVTRETGRKMDRAIIAVLSLVVLLLLLNQFVLHRFMPIASTQNAAVANDKSIAVLPFQNLSDDKSNAYFAEGIQDEILTRLAGIASLKVISRTSTAHYASSPDNLPEIARQLGVANILEGSVQKAGDQVHINVQLVAAAGDTHLWAQSYDRRLDNIFGVEAEVAQTIAQTLQARLTGAEKQELASRPTANAQAWEAYLRGIALFGRGELATDELAAAQSLQTAVQLDPGFALAWAWLAKAHAALYFERNDATPARRQDAGDALQQALKLAPDLLETQIAQGYYDYWIQRDYEAARRVFEQVRIRVPNNADAAFALALIARRQGRWDESIALYDEALELDPRNIEIFGQAGATCLVTRRYPRAIQLLDRALDVSPSTSAFRAIKALAYQMQGRLDEADEVLSRLNVEADDVGSVDVLVQQHWLRRRYAQGIALLQSLMSQLDDTLAQARARSHYRFLLGEFQRAGGDAAAARTSYLQVRDDQQALLASQPGNEELRAELALTQARLGEQQTSLKLANEAVRLLPASADAVVGPGFEDNLVRIQAQFGDRDAVFAALPHLLATPYEGLNLKPPVTPALLRLDPDWDFVRNDPRFQKLIADASAAAAAQP